MNDTWSIGIDVGGTKTKVGIVRDNGSVLEQVTIPTEGAHDPACFAEHVRNHAMQLLECNGLALRDISFIGAGVPGTVSSDAFVVEYAANIPWTNVPFGAHLEHAFDRVVPLQQDVRLAALAEQHLGAGQSYRDILCVVIGTGIGAGIIQNSALLQGAFNSAGEMGHMIVEKNGRHCACGQRGCLERYASGTGIAARAEELLNSTDFAGRPHTAQSVFELAQEGNATAQEIIAESVDYLALGIANVVNVLGSEIVIIGGGVAQNPDTLFFTPLKERIYQYGYEAWAKEESLRISKAALGTDAPMIGAALMGKVTT